MPTQYDIYESQEFMEEWSEGHNLPYASSVSMQNENDLE